MLLNTYNGCFFQSTVFSELSQIACPNWRNKCVYRNTCNYL